MFEIFKKKSNQPAQAVEVTAADAQEEKQVELEKIAVHVMPEHFRVQSVKVHNAKWTGLAIIGGGVVFLLAVSVGLYFYLFQTPSVTVKTEETQIEKAGPEEQPVINQNMDNTASSSLATSTEPATLPGDIDSASSTASSTPEISEQNLIIGLQPGLDSDGDGLTDNEEAIFGSSASSTDSDGDSYLDGAEFLNLYNPAGSGKLTVNPAVATYENKTFNYSLLYPKAWEQSANGGDDSVMFKSADNQFIQIIIQPNANGQTLDQWYGEQVGGGTLIDETYRVLGASWQGIKNPDGLTLYLMDNQQKYIFTITYNPGEHNILNYSGIVQMMIKSFVLND